MTAFRSIEEQFAHGLDYQLAGLSSYQQIPCSKDSIMFLKKTLQ
jgi:hypothetical protein